MAYVKQSHNEKEEKKMKSKMKTNALGDTHKNITDMRTTAHDCTRLKKPKM
jgi:hypothetical protein